MKDVCGYRRGVPNITLRRRAHDASVKVRAVGIQHELGIIAQRESLPAKRPPPAGGF